MTAFVSFAHALLRALSQGICVVGAGHRFSGNRMGAYAIHVRRSRHAVPHRICQMRSIDRGAPILSMRSGGPFTGRYRALGGFPRDSPTPFLGCVR